jgi:hypothetical protein
MNGECRTHGARGCGCDWADRISDEEIEARLQRVLRQARAASDLGAVTRFEVIGPGMKGRRLVEYGVEVHLVIQDEGRTLKVFLRTRAGGDGGGVSH